MWGAAPPVPLEQSASCFLAWTAQQLQVVQARRSAGSRVCSSVVMGRSDMGLCGTWGWLGGGEEGHRIQSRCWR